MHWTFKNKFRKVFINLKYVEAKNTNRLLEIKNIKLLNI
jgi:hypothetical protein